MFSLRTLLLAALASFVLGGGATGCVVSKLAQGEMDAHLKADADAKAEAERKARVTEAKQTDLSQETGSAAAEANQKIVYRTIQIVKEIPTYVTPETDARHCIPWGVVRVLDAAALGRDPAGLPAPSGEPDDTCSTVDPSDLAAGVAANYGAARENADQLDRLIADIKARAVIHNDR